MKKLNLTKYSFKDLSSMMDVSYNTIRHEVVSNKELMQRLQEMGWQSYARFRREHVLEIFRVIGYPDGYEWYEKNSG